MAGDQIARSETAELEPVRVNNDCRLLIEELLEVIERLLKRSKSLFE